MLSTDTLLPAPLLKTGCRHSGTSEGLEERTLLTDDGEGQGHPPNTGGKSVVLGATCRPPTTFSCVVFLHPHSSLIFRVKKLGTKDALQGPQLVSSRHGSRAHTFLSYAPSTRRH